MKMRFLFIPCLMLFTANLVIGQRVVKKYIKMYEDIAIERMQKYQIPASIILGVSLIESGAGSSDLARVFHNFFGIKGTSKNSKAKLGYQSEYKEYPDDTASFDHFCRVLANKRFYKQLKGEKNYHIWLKQMNKASYAEAQQSWIDKITAAIDQYKLYKLDKDMPAN